MIKMLLLQVCNPISNLSSLYSKWMSSFTTGTYPRVSNISTYTKTPLPVYTQYVALKGAGNFRASLGIRTRPRTMYISEVYIECQTLLINYHGFMADVTSTGYLWKVTRGQTTDMS